MALLNLKALINFKTNFQQSNSKIKYSKKIKFQNLINSLFAEFTF